MKRNILLAFIVFVLFLTVGVATNNHYGVSWDEPEHFLRGQAYLRLFLTGKGNYSDLVEYDLNRARSDPEYHERSYYEHDSYTASAWFVSDRGHPPLNDILAAFFNQIFYQKLGIVADIEGYHIFNIFISSILVGAVFLFAMETFGLFAGIFSAVFMATYPLFWAESHFNIKDPAESAFFVLTLYFLWKGVHTRRLRPLILASIFAGFALSVKFNILFLPIVAGPWLLLVLVCKKRIMHFIFDRRTVLALLLFPVVMLGILILVWPFLWQDIFGHLLSVFTYYRELGTEEGFNLSPINQWSLYATRWLLFTTPPLTLLFFVFGLFCFGSAWKKSSCVFILWLLLFLIPVFRVSFPNTSIYGGVRQIMEYIPAMALIAGVGADQLRRSLNHFIEQRTGKISRWVSVSMACGLLAVGIYPLCRLHPNENVYFNFLIGGLSGAVQKNIPASGNSYGNAYWQVVQWLNKNAEEGARIALIQGTSLNIPTIKLRQDIDFSNSYWSGIYRDGEYLVELTSQNSLRFYPYAWEYVERLLDPVYEVEVDGIAIAKVWKNDLAHTKSEMRKEETIFTDRIEQRLQKNTLVLSLDRKITLSRLEIFYGNAQDCKNVKARVYTSLDGRKWQVEEDEIPVEQVAYHEKNLPDEVFFFAGKDARLIKLEPVSQTSCFLSRPRIQLRTLEKLE